MKTQVLIGHQFSETISPHNALVLIKTQVLGELNSTARTRPQVTLVTVTNWCPGESSQQGGECSNASPTRSDPNTVAPLPLMDSFTYHP